MKEKKKIFFLAAYPYPSPYPYSAHVVRFPLMWVHDVFLATLRGREKRKKKKKGHEKIAFLRVWFVPFSGLSLFFSFLSFFSFFPPRPRGTILRNQSVHSHRGH